MKVARTVLRRATLGNRCRLSDRNELRLKVSYWQQAALLEIGVKEKY